jgi:hypothetical protein
MHKFAKATAQHQRELLLARARPKNYIVKGESLFDRGRKFGMECNNPEMGNRERRRKNIKEAIRTERGRS